MDFFFFFFFRSRVFFSPSFHLLSRSINKKKTSLFPLYRQELLQKKDSLSLLARPPPVHAPSPCPRSRADARGGAAVEQVDDDGDDGDDGPVTLFVGDKGAVGCCCCCLFFFLFFLPWRQLSLWCVCWSWFWDRKVTAVGERKAKARLHLLLLPPRSMGWLGFFVIFFAPTRSPACFLFALALITSAVLRRLVFSRWARRPNQSKGKGDATR